MKIILLGNYSVDYSSESHHAATLESLGHDVVRLQESQAPAEIVLECALNADLLVWIHTHKWPTPGNLSMIDVLENLKNNGIPTLTYHLDLWFGISRQKDIEDDPFYKHIGHFFTCDKLMADWFNKETNVKGHYIPAGVFDDECYIDPDSQSQAKVHDVIFVGSRGYHPEWPWRPQLVDWLKQTYGNRFRHFGGDGEKIVRGNELNQLYANTKVVVGDSLNLDFNYPWYRSDRYFETPGRGGFMIFPRIYPLESNCFLEDKEMVYFKHGDFNDLKKKIDYYLTHDEEREVIRKAGFSKCKQSETYTHRWTSILEILKEDL